MPVTARSFGSTCTSVLGGPANKALTWSTTVAAVARSLNPAEWDGVSKLSPQTREDQLAEQEAASRRMTGASRFSSGKIGAMTGRVFILGSGFSKAINARMPTMDELSAAVIGELSANGLPMPPGYGTPVEGDFERWLSYLVDSPPWLTQGQQERNHASFSEIASAVSAVLNAVQFRAAGDPQPAWLPQLVTHWQNTNAAVITFNYDVLVELAWLELFGGPHVPWSHLYAVPLSPAAGRTSGILGGDRPVGGMRLLKLHGSLNWFYSGSGSPPGDTVYDIGITGGWSITGVAPRYDKYDVADKQPFIVPPAAVKNPYYANQALQGQWRLAAEAIKEADDVVIMGFGLPPSDLLVSSMLATLITPDHTVFPVSPDATLPGRMRNLLEPSGPPSGSSQVVDAFVGSSDPVSLWTAKST
jgi:hypothetical protein